MLVAGDYNNIHTLNGEEHYLPLVVRRAVEDAIQSCEDVDELIDVLDWMNTFSMHLVGSKNVVYPSHHLVNQIYKGHAALTPRVLTRTLGLREKYLELTA